MSRHIHGFRDGSVAERLNMSTIRALPVPLPPLPEQRAIAEILGSLDDKIEANRRQNETLEATARAIFKSWFVDFDPVHAKARGETPHGMDAATAALFPAEFEESELGLIPRGWGVGSFDEGVEIIGGGTPKTSIPEYWDGNIYWFSVRDIPSSSDVFVIETEKKITQQGVNNSSTKILPMLTTIITARGTVGKLALTGVEMAMNQSCYAIRGSGYPDFFTFFNLKTRIAELQQQTHGTVFDTITRDTFSNLQTVLPSSQIAQLYDAIVAPILEQIRNNVFESRTLAETRDALLPRLVSGELRVGEMKDIS
jgi:type I restriction enzyme S subunit